jgi:hypothetical protein
MIFLLYIILYLFIITINIILFEILFRFKLDNIIFKKLETKLTTTVSCFGNFWFIIKKTNRMLDILYIERDGAFLSCNIEPKTDDIVKSCGLTGQFNNKSNPCNVTISELMFLI